MRFKKLTILIVISTIIFSTFVQAEKKRPPRYTLKDLSDPESPSYVPYPFPKNDFEVLEDFKYGIKKMRLHKQPGYNIFLLDKRGISVDKIVRVEEKYLNAPYNYYYLFHVKKNGEIIGVGTVNEFGLVMSTGLVETEEQKKRVKPFKDKIEVEKIIDETLGKIKIEKMKLVHRVSDICNEFAPMWEVETLEGTYFVDHRNVVWAIDYETPATDEKIKTRTKIGVLDEEKDVIKFLKKVEKKQ
ncbi:MAG: hypothetical protein U9O50_02670 [Acidobacteriota bacterium]|nr:hypothetical protein [Acidobacteriota bacterium]